MIEDDVGLGLELAVSIEDLGLVMAQVGDGGLGAFVFQHGDGLAVDGAGAFAQVAGDIFDQAVELGDGGIALFLDFSDLFPVGFGGVEFGDLFIGFGLDLPGEFDLEKVGIVEFGGDDFFDLPGFAEEVLVAKPSGPGEDDETKKHGEKRGEVEAALGFDGLLQILDLELQFLDAFTEVGGVSDGGVDLFVAENGGAMGSLEGDLFLGFGLGALVVGEILRADEDVELFAELFGDVVFQLGVGTVARRVDTLVHRRGSPLATLLEAARRIADPRCG